MAKEDNQDEELDESVLTLTAMLKASDNSDEDDSDEDDEEDDKAAEYMKKRKMKGDKSSKNMKKMKKAVDHEAESLEDEIDDAEAVLINGTEFLQKAQEHAEKSTEVIQNLTAELESQSMFMKAMGSVMLEIADQVSKMGKEPQPRKSVTNAGEANLAKADTGRLPEGVALMKATEFMQTNGFGAIKQLVMKAFVAKDPKAGMAMSQLEMSGGKLNLLPASTQKYIASLVAAKGMEV